MLAPALFFLILNHGRASVRSVRACRWRPTSRSPSVCSPCSANASRPPSDVLLLALAVIDDVGAHHRDRVFYSGSLWWPGSRSRPLGWLTIVVLQKVGVRSPWAYLVPATVIWAGAYRGGIHPTLAGVIVGLMTPVQAWLVRRHLLRA